MKLLSIAKKDLKLLFRSKASAFTVLVAPILIIALILFAFSSISDSSDLDLSVGYTGIAAGEVNEFLLGLEDEGYVLFYYDDLEPCVTDVKLSLTNVCLSFPEGFSMDLAHDNSDSSGVELDFYIDQSRINVAQAIITSVGSQIESTSEDLTTARITQTLSDIRGELEEISVASTEASDRLSESTEESLQSLESSSSDISSSSSSLVGGIDSSSTAVSSSLSTLTTGNSDYDELLGLIDDLLSEVESLSSRSSNMQSAYDALNDFRDNEASTLESTLEDLQTELTSLEDELDDLSSSASTINLAVESVDSSFDTIEGDVEFTLSSLRSIDSSVNSGLVLSGASLENKFGTKVHEIVSSSDKSLFMFPYYMAVLLLFVGLILGSNLIVIERQSQAYFRNNSSPTGKTVFLLMRFLMLFMILSLQTLLVLLAGQFLLHIPVFSYFSVTAIVLVLSISMYILFGFLIGYLFKTQESTSIALLSLGGAMAFLSNLILPMESFSSAIRGVLSFNPYMLTSELMKKTILFSASLEHVVFDILLLVGYVVVLIIAVVILSSVQGVRIMRGRETKHLLLRPHFLEDGGFRLESCEIVRDIADLELVFKSMKAEEMVEYGGFGRRNEFALWVRERCAEKKLGKALSRCKDVSSMYAAIMKFLHGEGSVKKSSSSKSKKKSSKDSSKSSKK